jgi:hypothetical protein
MGHLEYIAMAPHANPMLDQSFWHGLLWLHLIMVANVDFPDFCDWKKLFLLPTYPTSRDGKHYSRQQYRMLWLSFFADAKVYVGKLTHIWRGQGQQELDELGVKTTTISRMTGHSKETGNKSDGPIKSQAMSYITNPPTDGVVSRAGGNWKQPGAHYPPRETVIVSSNMLLQIPQVAHLIDNYTGVQASRANCRSFKEIQEKRLVTACGSLGAILNNIESVFKCLVSRPVDPRTMCIDTASHNLFMLLKNTTTLHEILSHDVFAGAEFISLCEDVKAAEDRCFDLSLSATHSNENESTRCRNAVYVVQTRQAR